MGRKTVVDMIEKYLRDNGFDGLFSPVGQCACELDDLAPCCEIGQHCEPGYKHAECAHPEIGYGEEWYLGGWVISRQRPEPDEDLETLAKNYMALGGIIVPRTEALPQVSVADGARGTVPADESTPRRVLRHPQELVPDLWHGGSSIYVENIRAAMSCAGYDATTEDAREYCEACVEQHLLSRIGAFACPNVWCGRIVWAGFPAGEPGRVACEACGLSECEEYEWSTDALDRIVCYVANKDGE